ncbi:MAG: RagB/SusD family nutrient uptake outer membrane protein [Bacteroidales bacterium]|nr:RagB/SusD family nutrient uptake outer membrane protein [Bacteroidales bacterium]MDT8430714.1 RagB/SusD family nutrient uptake outer membrane protein [Bacteroidales bacterium]
MNKVKYLIVPLMVCFISCEERLNLEPKEFLSPEGFTIENDIVLALNGTYKALTGMGLAGGDYQNIDPLITDFMTDNGFMDKSWMGVVEFWDQGQNQNSALAERKWARNYMGILRANTVLAYIDQVSISNKETRKRYEAEARFLRAFFYSDLIQFFGNVPFRLDPEGLDRQHKERASRDTILEFIYEELDSAANYLPAEYSEADRGRATSGAARTLKAWVALNNYDYEIVLDESEAVIATQVYEIFPDYTGLFLSGSEGINKEVIFDAQYLEGKTEELLTSPWTTYFYAWSSYQADYNLVKEYYMADGTRAEDTNPAFDPENPFEGRDPRLSYTLTLPYTFDGYQNSGAINYFIPFNKKAYNFTSLRIRKWVDYEEDYNLRGHKQSGSNNIFFRYADLLLMRAEALCETGGAADESEIISLVNQVRQRPGVMMPVVEESEGTGLTQDELREIVRHERRVELAFEGSRIVDIARWDIGESAYVDGKGYDPNLLFYHVLNNEALQQIEADGLMPNDMLRYLRNPSYFFDKIFKTEELFRNHLSTVFSPERGFENNEVETYGDLLVDYVKPRYEIYSFRERNFDAVKGYLWPVPYTEIQSNELININNPGY